MIKLEKVNYEAGDNVILKDVSFFASKNTTSIIYYDSGSGATTFAKILSGLISPNSGSALINNKKINPSEINASLLLSSPIFFKHKSALKNIMRAAKDSKRTISKQASEKVLAEFGIEPKQKPKKLTTTQKILLSFARSSLLEKTTIIADDVFKCLSEDERSEVMPRFISLIHGKTTIILDSTKKIEINGAKKYYLSFGELYTFSKPAKIWQIYELQHKNAQKHIGKIFESENGFCLKEGNKLFFADEKLLKNARLCGVEDVLFDAKKNLVVAAFDAMDFERIL